MKHIYKKTLDQMDLKGVEPDPKISGKELLSELNKSTENLGVQDLHAYLFHSDGMVSRAFGYINNDSPCFIPLANPVLLHFNEAYNSHLRLTKAKKEFFELYTGQNYISERSLNVFYEYFGPVCSCAQSLINAMEAFVNYNIPDDYLYQKNENKRYDKNQIQRRLPLEDKIEYILNPIKKRNFRLENDIEYSTIIELKQFRDSVVHTKQLYLYKEYQRIFEVALSFDFASAISAVKDFINFYEERLIEPCPCDLDY